MKKFDKRVEKLEKLVKMMDEEEDVIKWEELGEELDDEIEKCWIEYEEEMIKYLEKIEIEKWDFVDYCWKMKDYMKYERKEVK